MPWSQVGPHCPTRWPQYLISRSPFSTLLWDLPREGSSCTCCQRTGILSSLTLNLFTYKRGWGQAGIYLPGFVAGLEVVPVPGS